LLDNKEKKVACNFGGNLWTAIVMSLEIARFAQKKSKLLL